MATVSHDMKDKKAVLGKRGRSTFKYATLSLRKRFRVKLTEATVSRLTS